MLLGNDRQPFGERATTREGSRGWAERPPLSPGNAKSAFVLLGGVPDDADSPEGKQPNRASRREGLSIERSGSLISCASLLIPSLSPTAIVLSPGPSVAR